MTTPLATLLSLHLPLAPVPGPIATSCDSIIPDLSLPPSVAITQTVLLPVPSSNIPPSTANQRHLQAVNQVFTLAMARQHFPMNSPSHPPRFTTQACLIPVGKSSPRTSSRPFSAEPTVDLLTSQPKYCLHYILTAAQGRHKCNIGDTLLLISFPKIIISTALAIWCWGCTEFGVERIDRTYFGIGYTSIWMSSHRSFANTCWDGKHKFLASDRLSVLHKPFRGWQPCCASFLFQ